MQLSKHTYLAANTVLVHEPLACCSTLKLLHHDTSCQFTHKIFGLAIDNKQWTILFVPMLKLNKACQSSSASKSLLRGPTGIADTGDTGCAHFFPLLLFISPCLYVLLAPLFFDYSLCIWLI